MNDEIEKLKFLSFELIKIYLKILAFSLKLLIFTLITINLIFESLISILIIKIKN